MNQELEPYPHEDAMEYGERLSQFFKRKNEVKQREQEWSSQVIQVGPHDINLICYQSFPCQHQVKIKGKWTLLDATTICRLLAKDGLSHSHFDYAKDLDNSMFEPLTDEEEDR